MSNKTAKSIHKELSSDVLASKSWKEKCVIKKKKVRDKCGTENINWNNVNKQKKSAIR